MNAENNATKGKCIGELKETEANGEMDTTSTEVHAEAETGNAVGSGSVELLEKPIDSPENKKTEDQQAVVVEIESPQEDNTDQTPTKPIAAHASNRQNSPEDKAQSALKNLPTRQYLDMTIVPILLQALSALAKERPVDPIEFVANYLLKEKPRFNGGAPATSANEH
uniref:Protein dpy-30 homolog n=1 Tax=Globodera rostochiensis TaxID=31243 RepID=A0A914HJJ9_GLORO